MNLPSEFYSVHSLLRVHQVCVRPHFFCARQCSKPCDASSVSEEAGNLGFGFSPELLSFTFSSGMLPSGAHTLSLPQTHTESLIITGQLRSVRTGSAASFLYRIKTPVPFLLILNIGLQTLKENIYTHRLTKNALIKCRCSGAECMMQQQSHPCLCSLGERRGRGAPEKKETYQATRKRGKRRDKVKMSGEREKDGGRYGSFLRLIEIPMMPH